jgi:LysM repeat protein
VALQAGKAAPVVAIAGAMVAAPSVQHSLAASTKPLTATAQGQTVGSTVSHPAKGLPSTTGQTVSESSLTGQNVPGNGTSLDGRGLTGTSVDGRDLTQLTKHTATLDAYATRSVTVASTNTGKDTYYTVRSGDSLSTIAERYYHNPSDWQYLYHQNENKVANPNDIYPGEKILIPASAPAHATAYVPKHARTRSATTTASTRRGSTIGGTTDGGNVITQAAAQGMYSCSALEQLWDQAGGNASDSFMAAEIARAESGGNPNAISPTADYGLWQINASNGSLATLNPYQNARSAIILSHNGSNWNPWTTYHSGAYYGKC